MISQERKAQSTSSAASPSTLFLKPWVFSCLLPFMTPKNVWNQGEETPPNASELRHRFHLFMTSPGRPQQCSLTCLRVKNAPASPLTNSGLGKHQICCNFLPWLSIKHWVTLKISYFQGIQQPGLRIFRRTTQLSGIKTVINISTLQWNLHLTKTTLPCTAPPFLFRKKKKKNQ